MNTKILLETGTNELEIIIFRLGESFFGINVAKVREIINFQKPVKWPKMHKSIEGIIKLRDEIVPMVNLTTWLQIEKKKPINECKIIITEFNNMKIAFLVHEVENIYRKSWDEVEPPTSINYGNKDIITGVIKLSKRIVLLLDFEKIIGEINPNTSVERLLEQGKDIDMSKKEERSKKPLLFADDSPMIRKAIKNKLAIAGYSNLTLANDGKDAWEKINEMYRTSVENQKDILEFISLIITDIEMPQMDGLHLVKRLKDTEYLKKIPVIIFSSIAHDANIKKAKRIGAEEVITKPEVSLLIKKVDNLVFN